MKTLIVVDSHHHLNTEKIARVFAEVLEAPIRSPRQVSPGEFGEYDFVGFGSGIDSERHYKPLLDLAEALPRGGGKSAFIFSTCGLPAAFAHGEQFARQVAKNHLELRRRLEDKGYVIVDEFSCAAFNTNSFLKLFGGLNRGRPNVEDLRQAEEFARGMRRKIRCPQGEIK